MKRGTVGYRLC